MHPVKLNMVALESLEIETRLVSNQYDKYQFPIKPALLFRPISNLHKN